MTQHETRRLIALTHRIHLQDYDHPEGKGSSVSQVCAPSSFAGSSVDRAGPGLCLQSGLQLCTHKDATGKVPGIRTYMSGDQNIVIMKSSEKIPRQSEPRPFCLSPKPAGTT